MHRDSGLCILISLYMIRLHRARGSAVTLNADLARAASVVERQRPERGTTIRACEAGTSPAVRASSLYRSPCRGNGFWSMRDAAKDAYGMDQSSKQGPPSRRPNLYALDGGRKRHYGALAGCRRIRDRHVDTARAIDAAEEFTLRPPLRWAVQQPDVQLARIDRRVFTCHAHGSSQLFITVSGKLFRLRWLHRCRPGLSRFADRLSPPDTEGKVAASWIPLSSLLVS
jgi:hypothetical protein